MYTKCDRTSSEVRTGACTVTECSKSPPSSQRPRPSVGFENCDPDPVGTHGCPKWAPMGPDFSPISGQALAPIFRRFRAIRPRIPTKFGMTKAMVLLIFSGFKHSASSGSLGHDQRSATAISQLAATVSLRRGFKCAILSLQDIIVITMMISLQRC